MIARGAGWALVALGVTACGASNDAAPPRTPAAGGDASAGDASSPVADLDAAISVDAGGDGAKGGDASGAGGLAVRVSGGGLVDGAGKPLRLIGVDHSGTEYACIQGNGIFDGASDDAMITAIVGWRANAVRVPLNEDCWLAINGAPAAYSGAAYRTAITQFVQRLHAHGLYAILDLHWTAPGTDQATAQQPMADKDHAIDFWRSVAGAFAADPATVLDLFNEPFLDTGNAGADPWGCWKSGCPVTFNGKTYASAGMQDLIDAVRSTGATNVAMVGGLAYANDLSGWLAHEPSDPSSALAASFHLYNFNACSSATCWDAQVKPITSHAPVVTGELGEDDCLHTFVDGYMAWADAAKVSYLAWTWNAWGGATSTSCGTNKIVLVADTTGTPTPYGLGIKQHYAALP